MFGRVFTAGTALFAAASALVPRQSAGWPYAPFTTSGRDIVNSKGDAVTYAGINWSGHGEAMIPEGLQYQSIETIVSRVKSLGMNVIRLTYAIEMIDDIIDGNPNSSLKNSFVNALGSANGTAILQNILKNNPQFTEETTRIEVFDAVAAECLKQQIYIHQDNHMSEAAWCCNADDGNAWFGDTFFNVDNWKRGIAWMANHGKNWPAMVSVALRNELRQPVDSSPARSRYGWADWYANVIDAANGVNAANPTPLIFYSGLNFDTDLRNVTAGLPLNDQGDVFDIKSFSYANKIVFELHNYNNGLSDSNCANFNMYSQGCNAMDESSTTTAKNIAPVVMTEFGFSQTETEYLRPYAQCIKEYVTSQRGGWMQWVISGSYYIRQGQQDYDETWAMMNHDWSDWRSQTVIDQYLIPFVKDTLQT